MNSNMYIYIYMCVYIYIYTQTHSEHVEYQRILVYSIKECSEG